MKNTRKSIAITGANGFIAKNLRKTLSSEYDLVSLSRNNFSAFENETKVVTRYDKSSLVSNLKHCDVLVHLIGTGKQNIHSQYDDVNTKITSNLVDACKSTSIQKIVYLSGLGVSARNTSHYFISKYNAEQNIIDSGLDYTVFRPSYVIGKNDYLTRSLVSQIKKGKILIPGNGKYVIQPIHISDVASIIKDSFFKKKFSNRVIDLVGPEKLTFERYIKQFLNKTNVKISKIPLDESIRNALTNPNYVYSLDDLNILLGGFVGNFKKLNKIYGNTINPVKNFL